MPIPHVVIEIKVKKKLQCTNNKKNTTKYPNKSSAKLKKNGGAGVTGTVS